MMFVRFSVVSIALTSALAQASCFSVYDAKDNLVFRDIASPIDLSRPVDRQVTSIWPGGHLIVGPNSRFCAPMDSRSAELPGKPRSLEPVAMDAKTQKKLQAEKSAGKSDPRAAIEKPNETLRSTPANASSAPLTPPQDSVLSQQRADARAAAVSAMLAKRALSNSAAAAAPAREPAFKSVAFNGVHDADTTKLAQAETEAKKSTFRRRGRRG